MYTSKIDALINGLGQIEKGLEETSKGQEQLAESLPKLESGAGDVAEGQKQMKEKVGEFVSQLDQLTKGLNSSVDGLENISSGLMGAGDYLDQLKNASDQEMSGWFVPKEVLKNKQFQQVFNSYMSDGRQITTIDVILEGNPYGNGAIANVKDIEESLKRVLPDTHLKDASFGVGGVSSINADLKQLSDQDFSNTVIYMMIGIFLILVLLFRSIVMPAVFGRIVDLDVLCINRCNRVYFHGVFRLSRPQLGGSFLWICDFNGAWGGLFDLLDGTL